MTAFKLKITKLLKNRSHLAALLIILLFGIATAILASFNEINEGGGDNIWHYYFSRYAYKYPKFFLHHWGKPFFIFLSAPFSQLGYYGLNIFNIICGLLSAYVAYRWCKKMNLGYSLFVVVIVLFNSVLFATMQSGLTEPLFSLIVILSAYLLYSEKYFLGAVVASFLMYSRTEGVFIILIFFTYLLIARKIKYIPFLATAFIIYSFIGYFSGHDFLWFFTENPYNAKSPYGSGSYFLFLESYKNTYGKPYVVCFITGFIILLVSIFRNGEYLFWRTIGPNFKIFCLVFIPSIVFLVFHSYAWGAGKYASAGLSRVLASVIPLGAILCMITIDFIYKLRFPVLRYGTMIILLHGFIKYTFRYHQYPSKAVRDEKAEIAAAKWFKKERKPNSTIFYAHVGIVFHADYDPFDPLNRECYGFPVNCDPGIKDKFYYIWDSDFSEFSCHNKLEDLEKCPNLVKIKEFNETDPDTKDKFKLVFFESK